jgi:adenylate cyclase
MSVSRKLVAVFAADVEGYSRLMGADEVGTLKGLTERRAILDKLIGDLGGRIANTAGDSVLAEFGSCGCRAVRGGRADRVGRGEFKSNA